MIDTGKPLASIQKRGTSIRIMLEHIGICAKILIQFDILKKAGSIWKVSNGRPPDILLGNTKAFSCCRDFHLHEYDIKY